MAFAGNCGVKINTENKASAISYLFAQEAGGVIEYLPENEEKILAILKEYRVRSQRIGRTEKKQRVVIRHNNKQVLYADMKVLRQTWERTSHELEKLQADPECAEEERRNIFDQKAPEYLFSFIPEPTPANILESADRPKVAVIREEGSNGDREMISALYLAGFEPWDVTMSDLIEGRIDLSIFRGVVFVGGFSYADEFGSAKGWAAKIRFHKKILAMFEEFYNRPDTFSLGVCNGCQLMALLGWGPLKGAPDNELPRFIHNRSGRFESRWSTVKIMTGPSIMLQGMENSTLGIWAAHGEGQLYIPDDRLVSRLVAKGLAPVSFVDDRGEPTEKYPFNPNGSPLGITALCSADGRHLSMMPHPERAVLTWQWGWMPEEMKKSLAASPWLRMFQNAQAWCEQNEKK
jgi:phosphoribosylformylglycinamidine synthase